MIEDRQSIERIRSAEVVGALCLATDLGMGFPFEHGLHATLTTMRLCDLLGVDSSVAAQSYHACLLMYVGCTADADITVGVFGGSLTEAITPRQFGSRVEATLAALSALPTPTSPWLIRALQLAGGIPRAATFRNYHFNALCEVAEMLAKQLGLPPSVSELFPYLTERWDGSGVLRRGEGDELPLALRIVHVARDATYQRLIGDLEHVVDTIGDRAGGAFDPHVVAAFASNAGDILGEGTYRESVWEEVMAAEPKPWLSLEGEAIDRALAAMGAFADLASPHLAGHSAGVGELARAAASVMGWAEGETRTVGRAGHVVDVGKAAVDPRIWAKAGPLSADEWEQVRLHPYHTERVMTRSETLAPLGALAFAHHERLDGSGYPRGLVAGVLSPAARLLAAADAFRSKTEPRAYRPPYPPERAAELVAGRANAGKFDPDMVGAVVEAAGEEMPELERPAGLTEREAEVIGLVARGLQTKQVAHRLGISAKTADRHIQNAYRKIGVSSRAAAALFAAEHGLVPWGEFPIS